VRPRAAGCLRKRLARRLSDTVGEHKVPARLGTSLLDGSRYFVTQTTQDAKTHISRSADDRFGLRRRPLGPIDGA
jgi:hypothetical protein